MIIQITPLTPPAARPGAPVGGTGEKLSESTRLSTQTGTVPTTVPPAMENNFSQEKQDVSSLRPEPRENVEEIQRKADKANTYFKNSDTHLAFKVSEQTGRVIVHVVDSDTDEIVREIPPDTLNRFTARVSHIKGLLLEANG
jgi:flagellar protein FlaG